MKFLALAEPITLEVEAADAYEAANIACVLIARGLKPQDVTVWREGEFKEWSKSTEDATQ